MRILALHSLRSDSGVRRNDEYAIILKAAVEVSRSAIRSHCRLLWANGDITRWVRPRKDVCPELVEGWTAFSNSAEFFSIDQRALNSDWKI